MVDRRRIAGTKAARTVTDGHGRIGAQRGTLSQTGLHGGESPVDALSASRNYSTYLATCDRLDVLAKVVRHLLVPTRGGDAVGLERLELLGTVLAA